MTKSDGAEDTIGKWTEPWSRVVSYLALSVYAVLGLALVWVILDDLSYRGDKFDGLAAAFASVGLGVLAVPVVSTVLFLMFGGKWKFTVSSVLFGLVVLAMAAYLFSGSVTLHDN